jgi:hypothetical protein
MRAPIVMAFRKSAKSNLAKTDDGAGVRVRNASDKPVISDAEAKRRAAEWAKAEAILADMEATGDTTRHAEFVAAVDRADPENPLLNMGTRLNTLDGAGERFRNQALALQRRRRWRWLCCCW